MERKVPSAPISFKKGHGLFFERLQYIALFSGSPSSFSFCRSEGRAWERGYIIIHTYSVVKKRVEDCYILDPVIIGWLRTRRVSLNRNKCMHYKYR